MKSLVSQAAQKELERRRQAASGSFNELRKDLSPLQRQFVDDPHRFKIARCGRRAGKTHVDAAYLILVAMTFPKSPTMYLGLTRESAQEAIWQPLKDMLKQYNIPHEALESRLRIKFPNGSFIQLFGADTPNAKKRLRGRKFRLVIVDECGFVQEVDELVYVMLPTLADYGGSLCLTSSPGPLLSGLFYEADQGTQKQNWSQYHWTMHDNPWFMVPAEDPKFKTKAEEEFDTICRLQFGGDPNHPVFRREYWGEWIEDGSNLVYPYSPSKNLVHSVPEMRKPQYGIGIDLGSVSANAIVILQFSEYNREVYIKETWKQSGLLVDDLAKIVQDFIEKYQPVYVVADTGGYGKGITQEFTRRYHLPVIAAEKTDKSFHQRIMASDILSGYVKVLSSCTGLIKEWVKLVKDDEGEEVPKQENHLSDACLYIFRKVYQVHLKVYTKPVSAEEAMIARIEEQARREAEEREEMELDFQ